MDEDVEPASIFAENTAIQSQKPLLASFSLAEWQRLRHVCQVVHQMQSNVDDLKRQIDVAPETDKSSQELAWTIQCLRINLRQLESRVEFCKARVRTVTMKLCEVYGQQEAIEKKRILFDEQNKAETEVVSAKEHALRSLRSRLSKCNSQLARRRRQMLTNLMSIYTIKLDGPSILKRCNCEKLDFINRIHLPRSDILASSSNHSDSEIAAAFGHVAHFLSMLSCIFDLPLRYPIAFFGSNSTIIDLTMRPPAFNETERYPLYLQGRNRANFLFGIRLLNRNIEQLQSDCGIQTEKIDNTLENLWDLMRFLTGIVKSAEIVYQRPIESAQSLSSLLRTEEDGIYALQTNQNLPYLENESESFFARRSSMSRDASSPRRQQKTPSSASVKKSSVQSGGTFWDEGISTMSSTNSSL